MNTEEISIDMQISYLVLEQAERMYKKGILLDLQTLKENLKENILLWKKFNGGEAKVESSFLARTLSKLVNEKYMERLERGHYEITEAGSSYGGKLEEMIIQHLEFEFPNILKNLSGRVLNKSIHADHAHNYDIPKNVIFTDRNIANLAEKKYREDDMLGFS